MEADKNHRSCKHKEPSLSVNFANAKLNKIFVNNFDAVPPKMKGESLQISDNKRDRRNEFCKNKSTHDAAPEVMSGKILQEYPIKYSKNESSDACDSDSDDERDNCSDHNRNIQQDSFNISKSQPFDNGFSCSKNTQNLNNNLAHSQNQITFQNKEYRQIYSSNRSFPFIKSYAEKTTYCRPVYNLYNREFVNQTIEKNVKLQKLLKKIVIARQKEKEKEEWNNYVNELKNKHSYYSNEPKHISPQYVPQARMYPEPVNDFYNTKMTWNNSRPCANLMQAVYGYNDAPPYEYYCPSEYQKARENPGLGPLYANEQCCYPTSSQGRFMMLRRERAQATIPYHTKSNRLTHPIVVEKEHILNKTHFKRNPTITLEDCGCSPIGEIKNFFEKKAVQTLAITNSNKQVGETIKEQYERVSENVNKLKEKMETNQQKMQRNSSLKNIESKLDQLVMSLNNFMAEMKLKKDTTSPSLSPLNSILSCNNSKELSLRPWKSGSFAVNRKSVTIIGNAATNTSANVLQPFGSGRLRHATASTKIDHILNEEIDKSNKLRREIEELLPTQTNRPCVQITFDIPTKERATEVTNSLSKTKLSKGDSKVIEVIEEIRSPDHEQERRMTIAVNTDPLGLLALFRVSSEAIKQLMSYVDYNWYLSRLPLPQIARSCVLDYVCNICGAAFARPSQLSDHIRGHYLGNTKNCCVCRHALDSKRHCSSLFGCQYCGQVFTRAYCCELHQQSCARKLGKRSDDQTSSLVLLT